MVLAVSKVPLCTTCQQKEWSGGRGGDGERRRGGGGGGHGKGTL